MGLFQDAIKQQQTTPTNSLFTPPTPDTSTGSAGQAIAAKPNESLIGDVGDIAQHLPGRQVLGEIGNSFSTLGAAARDTVKNNPAGVAQDFIQGAAKQKPLQTAGDVAQTVGTAATLGGAGGLGTLGRIGLNAAEGGLITGGNTAAKGGTITGTLKSAGYGAAAGGVVGGALEAPGLIKKGLTSRVPGAIDSLEQKYQELAGSTNPTKKLLAKGQQATQAKNLAGTTGKEPARTLAEAGIVPNQEGTHLSTLEQAANFRKGTQPLNDALGTAIKSVRYSVEPLPVNALESSAVSRAVQQTMPESDKLDLVNGIKKEFSLLRDKYGDSMTIQEMHDAKPAYWGGTKFDSTKPFKSDAYYQVGKSLQKGVEDVAQKGGFEDVAQLNREIGDRLEASHFLEKLDNKVVKGGRLSKYAFKGIGALAGSSHGPIGTVIGSAIGDQTANILINNSVSTPAKRLILNHLEQTDPAAYTKTLKWLEQQGQREASTLKLAGPPKLGEPGNPRTYQPPRPDVSGVRSVPAQQMKGPGITPQGKFTKVFGNSPEDFPKGEPGAANTLGGGGLQQTPPPISKSSPSTNGSTFADKAKAAFNDIKKNGNRGFVKLPGIENTPKAGEIDPRLAPLADKDGMVTVYRAAPKFPSDTYAKDTHFATDPKNARYYAESHYQGSPSDITVRSEQIPASLLKRGGSADSWQLTGDYPASSVKEGASKGVLRNGQPAIDVSRNYPDTVARDRFNIPALKKISFGGSDRDVYDLGNGAVLKVSKSSRGLTQNHYSSDHYAEGAGLIPKTLEVGKNYVVKEKVNLPNAQTRVMVKKLQDLNQFYLTGNMGGFDNHQKELQKAAQIMNDHGYNGDDLLNYSPLWGDVKALRNWGTTNEGNPVMLDEGTLNGKLVLEHAGTKNMTDPEFRDIYNQSRAAKKRFGDTDKKTMYGVGAALTGAGATLAANKRKN